MSSFSSDANTQQIPQHPTKWYSTHSKQSLERNQNTPKEVPEYPCMLLQSSYESYLQSKDYGFTDATPGLP